MEVMGRTEVAYQSSAEFEANLREIFGEESAELEAAKKGLRDSDMLAMRDTLIEVDVTFRQEVKTLKQTNKKRRYRMVRGH